VNTEERLIILGRLLEARLRLRIAMRRLPSGSDDESLIQGAMDVAQLLQSTAQEPLQSQPKAEIRV